MLNITKLIVGFLLTVSLLSCKEESNTALSKESPLTPVKETIESDKPKESPLEGQISLMLEGNEGDQKILRHAVETIEWDVILKTWKDGIQTYKSKYGKAPEKKNIVRIHSTLSMVQADLNLEDSTRRRKKSLQDLEDTIKSAIEKEREKKQ